MAFIHRFGSSLNTHVHFHVCVLDGMFETVAGGAARPEGDASPVPQVVKFHAATGLDESAIAQVQADVRRRILRAFVARGHLEAHDAKDMAAYADGGGFSVDAGVRSQGTELTTQVSESFGSVMASGPPKLCFLPSATVQANILKAPPAFVLRGFFVSTPTRIKGGQASGTKLIGSFFRYLS